jgi:hypothetical protein
MISDVFASGFHGGGCPVELTAMHLEYVPKTVINLEAGFYILPVCGFGQPFGIVQQNFLAADLDQQGWQAAQIPEYR